MKRLSLGVAALLIATAAILLFVFLFGKGGKEAFEESSLSIAEQSADFSHGDETSAFPSEESAEDGSLLKGTVKIIEGGVYKLTITRQKQIGGLSVPVTTVTCRGDGFISIVEYEGHDIRTEVFINSDGAYFINEGMKTAFLFDADAVTPDTLEYEGLTYIESGSTEAGTSVYEYERYVTSSGQTVDYLFSAGSLAKMKLYEGEEYELISVSVSSDISGARESLPEGLEVIDDRSHKDAGQ